MYIQQYSDTSLTNYSNATYWSSGMYVNSSTTTATTSNFIINDNSSYYPGGYIPSNYSYHTTWTSVTPEFCDPAKRERKRVAQQKKRQAKKEEKLKMTKMTQEQIVGKKFIVVEWLWGINPGGVITITRIDEDGYTHFKWESKHKILGDSYFTKYNIKTFWSKVVCDKHSV